MSEAVQQESLWAYSDALEMYRDGAAFTELAPVLLQARAELDELIARSVHRAEGRETWETIGRALGMTRQGARKKYGPRS